MNRGRLLSAISIAGLLFAVVISINIYFLLNGLQLTHPLAKRDGSFARSIFEILNLPGIFLTWPALDILAHKDDPVHNRNDWWIAIGTASFWAFFGLGLAILLSVTRRQTVNAG